MGILSRFFSRDSRAIPQEGADPAQDERTIHLAFVLLSRPELPGVDTIIRAYRKFDPQPEDIQETPSESDDDHQGEIVSLKFGNGDNAFVLLVPAPVPNGEADHGAQFSVSSLRSGWKLPKHNAHLVVSLPSSGDASQLHQLSRFTSFLAGVTDSSPSVGVYWGNAGATHDSDFFVSIAGDPNLASRIMIWSGISIAREQDGRLSLLSLGMQQLHLPDLLLLVPKSSQDHAIGTFFDLLSYVAESGAPIPEGHTVGSNPQERLPVRYVRSPIDPDKDVWRVELK